MAPPEPPGPKPPDHGPRAPTPPQAELELADDALDLLDLTAPHKAAPTAPQQAGEAAQRHLGTVPVQTEVIASTLLPVDQAGQRGQTDRGNRRTEAGVRATGLQMFKRPLRAVGGLGAAALLAAVVWRGVGPKGAADTEGPAHKAAQLQHIAQLLPKTALGPDSTAAGVQAAAQPLPHTGAPEPMPLPEAHTTQATWATIDTLDHASLAAVEKPARQSDEATDLWAWAQCRRVLFMGDVEAKPALAQLLSDRAPPPQPQPLGHGRRRERAHARRARARAQEWQSPSTVAMRPLQAAAYGAAAMAVAPKERAHRTVELLRPLLVQTPQGRLVAALGEGLGRGSSRARAQHDQLTALLAQRPQMVDAALALAKSYLDSGDVHAAMARLGPLAMDEAADTWSRAAELMWQSQQMTALAQIMARKLGGTSPERLAQSMAQAAPAHRTVMRRLILRHLLEEGDAVAALSWAMAQAQAVPGGAVSQWDALRLAAINHAQAPASALEVLNHDSAQTAVAALALSTGAWRLQEPAWGAAAQALAAGLPSQGATRKLLHALAAEQSGSAQDAISALRHVSLGRGEPQAVATLARTQVASLRPNQAHERLEALGRLVVPKAELSDETLRPDLSEMALRRLGAAREAQRPGQTLQAAQNLLWLDPLAQPPMDTLRVWAQAASEQHVATGGSPEADPGLKRLEQLIAQRPQDDALVLQTIELARATAPARVAGLLQVLLLRHPKDVSLTVALVEAYAAAGAWDAARALVQPFAQDHGAMEHDGSMLYARAVVAQHFEPEQARGLVHAALQAGAPQARYYGLLATLELGHNAPDDALEALTRACTLAPQDAALQLRRARLMLGRKDARGADALIGTILTLPTRPEERAQAYLLRADIAREQNDGPATAQALRQALEVSRPDAAAALTLRLAQLELQELGQSTQALARLRALIARTPEEPKAHYLLGLALREHNEQEAAREAFARYLELAPQGEFAVDAQDAVEQLGP